jgi:Domain of unknown function (DUF4349)
LNHPLKKTNKGATNMKNLLMIAFLIGVAGCEQKQASADYYEKAPIMQQRKAANGPSDKALLGGAGYNAGFSPAAQLSSNLDKKDDVQKQMLIKNASLRFEVKKYDEARNKIHEIIKASNAYVVNEQESRSDFQISNAMTIRVPQSDFDNLIDLIVAQCKNLDQRSVNVNDVTEEYIDTDSRLKAKHEIESRYLEILKKAQNVKDILEIEQKLGGIREEIESVQGRLKYLSHQVAFSTIDLMFYENKNVLPGNRLGFLSRTLSAFIIGWNGLIEFLIGLISLWPALIVLAGISIMAVKLIKSRKKKGKSA